MAEHFARNVLNLLIFRRRSGIFRVAFLFDCHYLIENFPHIFRCVPAWQVFVVASCSSAATHLDYHFLEALSTRILNYFSDSCLNFVRQAFASLTSFLCFKWIAFKLFPHQRRIVFYHWGFWIASGFFVFVRKNIVPLSMVCFRHFMHKDFGYFT